MIPIFMFWRNPYWWLPTDEDRVNYRKERIENAQKELPIITSKMVEAQNLQAEAMKKLEATLTKEQWELWIEIRSKGHDAVFQNGRREHMHNLLTNKE